MDRDSTLPSFAFWLYADRALMRRGPPALAAQGRPSACIPCLPVLGRDVHLMRQAGPAWQTRFGRADPAPSPQHRKQMHGGELKGAKTDVCGRPGVSRPEQGGAKYRRVSPREAEGGEPSGAGR